MKLVAPLLLAGSLLSLPALAQQSLETSTGVSTGVGVGYQLETAIASTYVFRGIPQYNHLYEPSSQNTALLRLDRLGPGSLTVSLWNATALSGYGAQPGTALELDVSAGYSVRLREAFDVGIGYIGYLYPSHLEGAPTDGAHELTAFAAVQNPYVVPTLGVFAELLRQKGAYVAIGAARDLAWRSLTITPAVNLGIAGYRNYLGGTEAAPIHINDVTASLSGKVALPSDFYLSARVSYSFRGTPGALVPAGMDGPGFDGRSSVFGLVALGIAR